MRSYTSSFGALLCIFWACSWKLSAQVASTTNDAPALSFSGEQFCLEATLSNTGGVGYGPYYRVIVPASLSLDSATVVSLNQTITNLGTFPADPDNILTDPFTQTTITSTAGNTYYNVRLPVGAMVENGPELDSTLCFTIDANAVLGDPLTIDLQPVYRFGDTATGDNGAIEGVNVPATVTPSLFISSATGEAQRPTGADFTANFNYTIDVANNKTLDNVSLVTALAPGLQYVGPTSIVGGTGCTVLSEPDTLTPGGTLQVDCTSLAGTGSGSDLKITYPAYVTDVLDGNTCSSAVQTNHQTFDSSFNGNGLPSAIGTSNLDAKHLVIAQTNNLSAAIPGNTVTFTDVIQISSFATADSLIVTDTLADGFSFAAHTSMTVNGANTTITPSVTANGDGTTTIVYDIHGVTGNLPPGSETLVLYSATIDEDYHTAPDPILANDKLTATTSASYSLVSGATGCSENTSSSVNIATTTASKTLIAPQAHYVPGETAIFRLQHTILSGDSENIVFQDYLPLPAFDVADLNTTFGVDITRATTDTAGLNPSNITVDAATNSVIIAWPNLDVDASMSQTIAVDLAATVTNRPFADDQALLNLVQISNTNSANAIQSHIVTSSLQIRAPELVATLGVSASDNAAADATIAPAASTLPVDGDMSATDAGDETTFVLTIESVGGDEATEIVATVAPVAGMSNATLVSVVDGNGNNLVTSGSLEAGLSIADLAVNDGSLGAPYSTDTAIVTFTRTLDSNVAPRTELITSATVDYTADNSGIAYPQVSDDSTVTIADPTITTTIDSIVPGVNAPAFVVGDVVSFSNVISLPEGQTDTLVLTLTLPAGLQHTGTSLNTAGFVGTIDTSPTEVVSGVVSSGQQVTLTFDSPAITTVTDDNLGNNNQFTVILDTLVIDDAANAASSAVQAKALSASLSYTNFMGAALNDTASGNFSEHNLAISTSVIPATNLDAGDLVTISVDVTNIGTAPAYDVVVTDIVNSGGNDLFDLGSVAVDTIPAGYTFNYSNPTVTISADNGTVLTVGDTVNFTYTATVLNDVITGSSLSVDAQVSGLSLEDGGSGTSRSGSDNNATTATISALASDAIELIQSSEAWTTDIAPIEIAIGEILTFDYTVTVPEGITQDPVANSMIEITLPAGYQFFTGTALIRGEFDVGLSGATLGALTGANVGIVPDVSGQVLAFDLGDVTNSDADGNDERIIVTFDVLVTNTSDNNRTNNKAIVGAIHYNNAAGNPQTATSNEGAIIAESNIQVTKTPAPASVTGGDTVTFTLVATNTPGPNVTRAWEWQFVDNLPVDLLNPIITSATLSRGNTDIGACAVFVGNQLQLTDTCIADAADRYLAVGESITVEYTAQVNNAVKFEQTITNVVDVLVSSLPGSAGTGSVTPGAPDSDIGERTGSGNTNTSGQDVNDLVIMAQGTVVSSAPTLSLTSSGAAFAIATDDILLTAQLSVPVGTTDNFEFTLDLPSGLRYNGNAITLTNFGVLSTTGVVSTTPGAGTDPIVMDFGTVTNSTGSGVNVSIAVPVAIENVLTNQDGTLLTANATVTYQNIGAPIADSAVITVVEPNLTIDQTITAGAVGSDAGDTVSYQTTIQNTSLQATAFRVDLSNILPAGLLGDANGYTAIAISNPGDVVVLTNTATALTASDFSRSTTNNANDTLTANLFDIPPSTTLTLTYSVDVISAVTAGQVFTNQITASYHSLVDGTGRDGSTVNSDDDTDTDLNNYNESDSAILTLDAATVVQVGLNSIHSGSLFTIGDTVIYDVRVDVVEGITGNTEVTTELPSGISFVSSQIVAGAHISFDGPGTVVEAPAGTLTVDFGTLTNNADGDGSNDFYILQLTTLVTDNLGNTNGTILTTSAELSSDAGAAGPDTQAITIGEPNLSATLVPDNASASLGDTVTLTVTVTHTSSQADAFETQTTLNIPAGLTLITGSHSGAGAIDESDPSAPVINLGTITQADISKTFAIRVRVDEDVNINDTLSVSINGQYSSQSGTPAVERQYTFTTSTPITGNADAFIAADQTLILLTDNNGNGIADSGDVLQITALIHNNGANASNVVFTEAVPANTSYVNNSLTTTTGAPNDADPNALEVVIGSLNSNTSATITFDVTVDAGLPAGLIISAQGSVDSSETVPELTDSDGIDSNGDQANQIRIGNVNDDLDQLYIAQSFQLVNDADNDNNVSPGDTLTLFYDIQNIGTTRLNNLTLSDTLPAGLTYVGASVAVSGGGNSASVNAGILSASVASIDTLNREQVSFNVTVDGPLSGTTQTFQLQGTGNSDETSAQLADGNGVVADGNQPVLIHATSDSSGTPVLAGVLTYTLSNDTDSDGNVDNNDTLLLTAVIQNLGSTSANNASYQFTVPANTSFVAGSGRTSQGVIATDNPLNVNLGNIPVGGIATVEIQVTVNNGVTNGTVLSAQGTLTADNSAATNTDDNGVTADGINATLIPVITSFGFDPAPVLTYTNISDGSRTSTHTFVQANVLQMALTVTLPEGLLNSADLSITLPANFSYVGGSARLSRGFETGLVTAINPGNINVAASGAAIDVDSVISNNANVISVNLGDVINSDNDVNDETLTFSVQINTNAFIPTLAAENFDFSGAIRHRNLFSALLSHTDSQIITLENQLPNAAADSATVAEDSSANLFTPINNDTDLDIGQTLDITSVSAGNNGGAVVLNGDNSVSYAPAINFSGTETFTYALSDGVATSTGTFTITVTGSNDAPIANNDNATTNENSSIASLNVLSNDTDPDGDNLQVIAANAANGSVVINGDNTLRYTPNNDFFGADTINYTISDGNGETDSATVSVIVNEVNVAPNAVNDIASMNEDSTTTISVLANDSDSNGDALSVVSASSAQGSVAVNSNNTLEFTPNNNFNGIASIVYTISDGRGGSDSATVSVTVNAVNDDPVAVADSITVVEDSTDNLITVLTNDSDVDGDTLTVTSVSALNGTVSVNPDNSLRYTPAANANGSDTLTYQISDGNGGTASVTVTVTISAVNDNPIAVDDAITVVEDSTDNRITVLTNDSDADGDTLTVTSVSAVNGTVSVNPDNTLRYTPAANDSGSDTFTYQISDGNGGTASATVTVTISAVNDNPVAVDDIITVVEDSTDNLITVLTNDSDVDGDTLTVTSASAVNGTVSVNPDNTLRYTPAANDNGSDTLTYQISDGNGGTATATVTVNITALDTPSNTNPVANNDQFEGVEDTAMVLSPLDNDSDADGDSLSITQASSTQGTVTINTDGSLLFEPVANFNGIATIVYSINDGQGGTDTATITVNINPVVDPPQAQEDFASVGVAGSVTITVLDNDINPDGGTLTITQASSPNGQVVINNDGTLTFIPDADFNGDAQISYSIADNNGNTSTALVSVSVNSINNLPIVANETLSVVEDSGQTPIDVLSNDSDPDGDTLTLNDASAAHGTLTFGSDGSLLYQPDPDFSGNDQIVYTVSDGNGGLVSGTVNVTVVPVNDPPVANDDSASLGESGTVTINILANDTDADGDALTVIQASSDQGSVTINSDGTLIFEPNNLANGTATITYTIADTSGSNSTATVTITINISNALPIALADSAEVLEDSSETLIDVLNNDSDADGDLLSVSQATALNGSVIINDDGSLTYTPNANFNGFDTISYTVSDGNGGTATATVAVTVLPVNDAPIAINDTAAVAQNSQDNRINVLVNDSDPDGDSLTVIQANATNGTVTIGNDGLLQYTPNSGFVGTDTITYVISDSNGEEATATVSIEVLGSNQPPIAINDSATMANNASITLLPLDNDSDPDGDTITLVSATASNGSVIVNSDGSLTYTPDPDFTGIAVITYVISDGQGNSATGEIAITVESNNLPPVINAFDVTTQTGTPVMLDILSVTSDPDAQAVSISSATADTGTLVINSDGTVLFTPDPGFQGEVSLEICVVDTLGSESCAIFVVSVVAANLPPEVFDFSVTINEDEPLSLNLTGSDPEQQPLTYQRLSDPTGELTGELPRLVYIPPAHFNGNTAFTYQANDGELASNVATVNITVLPVNDPPIAVNDNVTIQFAQPVTITPLDNDFHPDNDTFTLIGATTETGTLTLDGDNLIFTPVPGFVGDAIINYAIADSDGTTASAIITVTILVDESTFFPVITLPDDVFVDANALFTKIDLGVASAVDRFGNPLPVSVVDGITFYEPGNNTAFWQTTDDEGRTTTASQSVRVRPLVSLEKDQRALEGHSVFIGVHLNGASPIYPLEIPYTVSGTAGSDDHNLVSGSIVFESGSDNAIRFDLFDDGIIEGLETIVVTLADTVNRGNKFQHVITIAEDNVDPEVSLFSIQNGEERVTVGQNDGLITVVSTLEHPDAERVFTYNWQSLDADFTDLDTDLTTYTFDATDAEPGVYRFSLAVTDNQAPAFNDNDILFINLVSVLPILDPSADSDGDGIPDSVEGLKDADGDGIPDFNDPISECNAVPQEQDFVDGFILEGDPGVCLRLGNFSIDSEKGGSKITAQDIDNLADLDPDTEAQNVGGIFDFIAYGIPEAGATHRTVIPLLNPIPQNAVYRKFSPDTGWRNFVISDRDQVWSSPGEPGYCAPPGGDIWVEGLVEDYWCVQVEIVDGGPNDADGLANGTVVDPGGVSVLNGSGRVNQQPQALDDFVSAELNTPLLVAALTNDSDPDGDTLTITSVAANFGSAEIVNNQVLFTPPENYLGDIQIGYGISDNSGGSARATIFIAIATVNQPPVAQDDSVSVVAGETVTINVLANDSDPDGEAIRVTTVTANDGVATLENDSVIRFTPDADFTGSTLLTYQIEDTRGGIDEAIVTINVTAAPVTVRIDNSGGGAMNGLIYLILLLLSWKLYHKVNLKRKHL